MSDFVFATAQYESGDWDSAPLVPANIIDSVARYTSLEVAPSGVIVSLSSRDLLRYPLVYLTGHLPVRLTEQERQMVSTFVERGGMLFIDDHNHDIDGEFHRTVTEENAPAKIVRASVFDPRERVVGNVLEVLSPEMVGQANREMAEAGQKRFTAEIRNTGQVDITAAELLWEALNAFGEKVGEKVVSFRFKKPIRPGKKRTTYNEAVWVAEDVSAYRVSLSRLKFEDDSTWSTNSSAAKPQPGP